MVPVNGYLFSSDISFALVAVDNNASNGIPSQFVMSIFFFSLLVNFELKWLIASRHKNKINFSLIIIRYRKPVIDPSYRRIHVPF